MRYATDDEMTSVRTREMLEHLASTRVASSTAAAYASDLLDFLRVLSTRHPDEQMLAAMRPHGLGEDVYPPAETYGRRCYD